MNELSLEITYAEFVYMAGGLFNQLRDAGFKDVNREKYELKLLTNDH